MPKQVQRTRAIQKLEKKQVPLLDIFTGSTSKGRDFPPPIIPELIEPPRKIIPPKIIGRNKKKLKKKKKKERAKFIIESKYNPSIRAVDQLMFGKPTKPITGFEVRVIPTGRRARF